jgi:hypothetical protein
VRITRLKLTLAVASLALLLAGGGVAYATTLAPRATSLYGFEKNNVVADQLTTGP